MGGTVLLQTSAHVQLAGLGKSVREVLYIIAQFIFPQFKWTVIIHFTFCNTPIDKNEGCLSVTDTEYHKNETRVLNCLTVKLYPEGI